MSTDNNTNFMFFFIVHIDAVFDLVVHFETESFFGRFDGNLTQRTS